MSANGDRPIDDIGERPTSPGIEVQREMLALYREQAREAVSTRREITELRAAIGSIGSETKQISAWTEGAGPHLRRTADETAATRDAVVGLAARVEALEAVVWGQTSKLDALLAIVQRDTTQREEPE